MTLTELNQSPPGKQAQAFTRCCGSAAWVRSMMNAVPFSSEPDLLDTAAAAWNRLGPEDWKEAFAHHPKIGDLKSLQKKFADTAAWASGEQSSVQDSPEDVLQQLAAGNEAYEKKFGYIFIVCATGKTAPEMLHLLEERLGNDPETEIKIAAAEQQKITRLRLEKLLA